MEALGASVYGPGGELRQRVASSLSSYSPHESVSAQESSDDSSDRGGEMTGGCKDSSMQDELVDGLLAASSDGSSVDEPCAIRKTVTNNEMEVRVDPPKLCHADWQEWDAYLGKYSLETMQVIVVKHAINRTERNRRVNLSKKAKQGTATFFPDGLGMYERTYVCTHVATTKESKSTGKRPRQHVRRTDCKFRFVVQWQMTDSGWKLMVKNGRFYHNHPVTADVFGTYHTSRGITDARVEARVEGMIAAGSKRSKIYDYLLEHDQNVIKADVDNMVAKRSSAVSSANDSEATAVELALFVADNPDNSATLSVNERGDAGVISLTTAHMRKMFMRFSEVLLVDCSHKTNRHNYHLLTIMGMNEFGEGVAVQQSLLETSSDWHMERALAHFKRANVDNQKLIRVIVVDKDMNEIRVLESAFPEARVLICQFHVLKWLKEKRAKPEFSKISSNDAAQIDSAVHSMVYAASQTIYNVHHEAFRDICSRVGLSDFFAYFEKNWDNCQDKWVLHHRSKLPHYKNHTNNRLESFFGKLKGSVNGSMSLAACVKELLASDRRAENEYNHKTLKIGQNIHACYDAEMAGVLRITTHYAAKQMEVEYQAGVENANVYSYESANDNSDFIVVSSTHSSWRLSLDDWWCDCEFAMTMRLPCRHCIAYRKHASIQGPVIPLERIDARWIRTGAELQHVKQFEIDQFDAEESGRRKKKRRTHAERFREASRATQRLSSELADIEDEDEFDRSLQFLLDQWQALRRGETQMTTCGDQDAICALEIIDRPNVACSVQAQNATTGKEAQDTPKFTLNISERASKVGRPKKDTKKAAVDERVGRAWYEATEKAKRDAGQRSLRDLADALVLEQPSLEQTRARLQGIIVKDPSSLNKRVVYKRATKPVLSLDTFYLLPPKLLAACVKALPVANRREDAIAVTPLSGTDATQVSTVEVVEIKGVGTFTREQIETFRRIENLKEAVSDGFKLRTWLLEKVLPIAPAHHHSLVNAIAEQVLSTFPYKRIPGLEAIPDHDFSCVYRLAPPTWLSDSTIRIVCQRLCNGFESVRFAGIQSALPKTRTRSKKTQKMDEDIIKAVAKAVNSAGVQTVLIPINFETTHWCAIVVSVKTKDIYFYDSLDQKSFVGAISELARHLKSTALPSYSLVAKQSPLQYDAFSCGVFVCLVFIRFVVEGCSTGVQPIYLPIRRFELLYYILTGDHTILLRDPSARLGARSITKSIDEEKKTQDGDNENPKDKYVGVHVNAGGDAVLASKGMDKVAASDSANDEDDNTPATQVATQHE